MQVGELAHLRLSVLVYQRLSAWVEHRYAPAVAHSGLKVHGGRYGGVGGGGGGGLEDWRHACGHGLRRNALHAHLPHLQSVLHGFCSAGVLTGLPVEDERQRCVVGCLGVVARRGERGRVVDAHPHGCRASVREHPVVMEVVRFDGQPPHAAWQLAGLAVLLLAVAAEVEIVQTQILRHVAAGEHQSLAAVQKERCHGGGLYALNGYVVGLQLEVQPHEQVAGRQVVDGVGCHQPRRSGRRQLAQVERVWRQQCRRYRHRIALRRGCQAQQNSGQYG